MKAGKTLIFLALSLTVVYCSNDSKKKKSSGDDDARRAPYDDPNCPENGAYGQQGGYGTGGQQGGYGTGGQQYGTQAGTGGYGTTSGGNTTSGGSGYYLQQVGGVTWEPTIRTAFQTSCASAGCHDAATRSSNFDYSNEASARQGLQAAIASVQSGRMPKNNPSFNQTNPQFLQQLQQWQQTLQNGGGYTGTGNYGTTGTGTYNSNCANPTTTGNQTGYY